MAIMDIADELLNIKATLDLIREKTGITLHITQGGLSVADPCGMTSWYIGIRDNFGNGIAITADYEGRLCEIKELSRKIIGQSNAS